MAIDEETQDTKPIEVDTTAVQPTSADETASAPLSAPESTPETSSQEPVATAAPNAAEVTTPEADASAIPPEELDRLTEEIIEALKTVYDPEIPSDIYELGLIYKVDINDNREVAILMTLTAPGCPVAGEMPGWVENAVNAVPGIQSTSVTLTFDPPWDQSRMSDEARLALNMF